MNLWYQNAFQFCVLKAQIRPEDFWKMSLPELNSLVLAFERKSDAQMSKSEFSALQTRYPDQKEKFNP